MNYTSLGGSAPVVAAGTTGGLAFTGINTVWLILTAFTLLLIGLALVRIAKGRIVPNRSAVK